MSVGVDDISSDDFSTSSTVRGDQLAAELVGILDMQTAPFLKRYLSQLVSGAENGVLREFEFNTEQLFLLSSSAISYLASWLKGMKALAHVRKVRFITNPNLGWQRRSLEPLRRLADELVTVD